mgnify:FL=1
MIGNGLMVTTRPFFTRACDDTAVDRSEDFALVASVAYFLFGLIY